MNLSEDYVARVSKQFENHDMTVQAMFVLAAGILTDICYGRAADKVLGRAKAFEVANVAWVMIGEYTTKLMSERLGILKVENFDNLKKIITAAYTAWMLPLNILEDTQDIFLYECLSCPFPAYGIGKFDVKTDDRTCRVWQAMTPAWLVGIIKEAGFADSYEPEIYSAICRGDSCCKVAVKKKVERKPDWQSMASGLE